MTNASQKNLQDRVEELESLLNLMTEYAALHTDGASFQGSFLEKTAFNAIAEDAQARDRMVEHCRAVLSGGA